jgi:2-polyprenyl-3-methyl-5-hydroxy-6-metoxy-1,4-benzoquinol methylase
MLAGLGLTSHFKLPGTDVRVHTGGAAAVGAAAALLAYVAYHSGVFSPEKEVRELTDDELWSRVDAIPVEKEVDAPIEMRPFRWKNQAEFQAFVFSGSTKTSPLVASHLISSKFKGVVLDLGSGIGANSIPLHRKGCEVTMIDQRAELLRGPGGHDDGTQQLQSLLKPFGQTVSLPTTMCADITTVDYPSDNDAVICMDTLPYLAPTKWRATLQKIHAAMAPGAKFIGSLFFEEKCKGSQPAFYMVKAGGHFCPTVAFAKEVIIRSGFTIIDSQVIDADESNSMAWEFVAIKS